MRGEAARLERRRITEEHMGDAWVELERAKHRVAVVKLRAAQAGPAAPALSSELIFSISEFCDKLAIAQEWGVAPVAQESAG